MRNNTNDFNKKKYVLKGTTNLKISPKFLLNKDNTMKYATKQGLKNTVIISKSKVKTKHHL